MRSAPQLNINDWSVAYSSYVDTLHVYQNIYNQRPKDKLINKEYGDIFIVLDTNCQLLLFEMKHASRSFIDIDKMDKMHIILRVKEMVKNHD